MINLTAKGINVEEAAKELRLPKDKFLRFPGVRFDLRGTGTITGYITLAEFKMMMVLYPYDGGVI